MGWTVCTEIAKRPERQSHRNVNVLAGCIDFYSTIQLCAPEHVDVQYQLFFQPRTRTHPFVKGNGQNPQDLRRVLRCRMKYATLGKASYRHLPYTSAPTLNTTIASRNQVRTRKDTRACAVLERLWEARRSASLYHDREWKVVSCTIISDLG
jgi:hypothetical protein